MRLPGALLVAAALLCRAGPGRLFRLARARRHHIHHCPSTLMINRRLIAAAFAALISCSLVNCASGPGNSTASVPSALVPSPGKGMLVVYREPGLAGAASKPFIWVDGVKLPGQLARGGYYTLQASPGSHTVVFSWKDHPRTSGEMVRDAVLTGGAGLILGGLGHEKISFTLNVSAGATHYVLMDGREFSEVSKEEGEEVVRDCRWLNPQ